MTDDAIETTIAMLAGSYARGEAPANAGSAKTVTLTLLLVSRTPGGTVAVAQLASPSGKTLTRYCLAVTEPGRHPLPADVTEAMQQAAEAAIAALKSPAPLRILTKRRKNLDAAAKAALGAGTRYPSSTPVGDAMGQQGRDAYAAGKRYLERLADALALVERTGKPAQHIKEEARGTG